MINTVTCGKHIDPIDIILSVNLEECRQKEKKSTFTGLNLSNARGRDRFKNLLIAEV